MDDNSILIRYKAFLNTAHRAAGLAIQKYFTDGLQAEFPVFRWIQTKIQYPAFQQLCFGYKNQVFSVLIAMESADGFFINHQDVENQLKECKANNMIATLIGIKEGTYKITYPGTHLVYSDSRNLVRLESFDYSRRLKVSSWELRNLGINHIVNELQKRGATIGGICDLPLVDPQIWFEWKGKQSYALVRPYIGQDKPSFKLNVNIIAKLGKYAGYYAEVGYIPITEGEESLYRGEGFYMTQPTIIPIDEAVSSEDDFFKEDLYDVVKGKPEIESLSEQIVSETHEFIRAIKDFNFKEFQDLMPILKPLGHIRIRPGFVMDGYMCGDERNGYFKLYACKKDSQIQYIPKTIVEEKKRSIWNLSSDKRRDRDNHISPYSDEMYIEGTIPFEAAQTVPSIYDYVELPFYPLPIWEAYLLTLADGYLPKRWHGAYRSIDIITGTDSLVEVCKDREDIDYSAFIDDERLTPSVRLVSDDKAIVSYCYWNSWSGLVHVTLEAYRKDNGVRFGEEKRDTLIEYDCGIRF